MGGLGRNHVLTAVLLLAVLGFSGSKIGVGNTEADDSLPKSKLSKLAAPTLKFLYW